MNSAGYHTVHRKKHYGLLIDPGAAHALIGVDTLLDLMRKIGIKLEFRSTDRVLGGIDGEPSEGLAKANFRLGISGLNASFDTDPDWWRRKSVSRIASIGHDDPEHDRLAMCFFL